MQTGHTSSVAESIMPQIEQMRGPLFLSTTALGSLKGALSFVFMTLTSFDFGDR
jgi:hypothetical protein